MLIPINPNASIILGFLTAFWGFWLLLPHKTFTSAALFSKMGAFAPEWAWGTWAVTCGLAIIVSVFTNNYLWLSRAMAFAVWHWSTVSGMMWWGDWRNTGGLTYTFVSMYAVFVYLNIKINYVKFGEKFGS